MSKSRKFKTVKALEDAWEAYKQECDSKMVPTHKFNTKEAVFVSEELKHSVTYTIKGFCVFAGISRQGFYEYYAENEKFVDVVTRMREECEVDARQKFELGLIPSQLAGLWMSNHGYSTKQESDVKVSESGKLDAVMSQIGGDGLDE